MKNKHLKKSDNKIKKIIIAIIFIVVICIILYYISTITHNQNNEEILNEIAVDDTQITDDTTERMLQIQELKKQNEDIVAWLEIEGTKINFPVLQTTDNEYYMKHNYLKEYSSDGAIFLDKDYDWTLPSSNLLIYGHNNKNGNMFQDLLEYEDENYYNEHKIIKFTTEEEDTEFEILAVFKSKVYNKSDTDVFKYYFFINAETEEEYNNYVSESKKISLYETGVTATYGEQLMTLSTCEYSQTNGRFAIVAKRIK